MRGAKGKGAWVEKRWTVHQQVPRGNERVARHSGVLLKSTVNIGDFKTQKEFLTVILGQKICENMYI